MPQAAREGRGEMPSKYVFPEGEADPQWLLDQLVHWLATATLHILAGVVLGMISARLMRGGHLHWSWAAAALALVLLARPGLQGPASTLALAAVLAATRG